MAIIPNLQSAIECIYRAFAGVERPKWIDACPCCMDNDEINNLVSKKLRAITHQELSKYAFKVFLTVGSRKDFRYFLPRILEILVTDTGYFTTDAEVVGRAVGTYTWSEFTAEEQAALVLFVDAVIRELVLAEKVDGHALDSWLCCSSHFIPKWTEYLSLVARTPVALTALYEWHSTALAGGAISNGFWDDSPRKSEFVDWLRALIDAGEIQAAYGL